MRSKIARVKPERFQRVISTSFSQDDVSRYTHFAGSGLAPSLHCTMEGRS